MNNTINNNDFISNIFKDNDIGAETRRILIKYIITSVILFVAACILLTILLNTGSSDYNIQKYFFVYMIPIFLTFGIILSLNRSMKATKLFLKLFGVISIMIFGIYLYATTSGSVNIDALSNYAIVTLIVIVGLGILYRALITYMERLTGWGGFIAQLIFYIPCVIYDVWEYLLQQVQLTPYSIYLFILFEFILIILYAFLPDISYKLTGKDNAVQLLDNVVFLDENEMIIANSDDLKIPKTPNQLSTKDEYLTNYCISMWLYINPHPPNHPGYNKETHIFSYGFKDQSGIDHVKPMIRYYGGGGGDDQLIERNKLIFYLSRYPPIKQYAKDDHTFYDLTIPMQKWNQIILNYNRNKVEIYLNGNLERTFEMNKNIPQYNDLDSITIGEENGIDGGICNITYYRHPLSLDQIALSYNTMVLSNLPVPRKKSKKEEY